MTKNLQTPTVPLIAERFEQGELIATGGMGHIYKGLDRHTGKAVAIKILKEEVVDIDPDFVTRFDREGKILRRLQHPCIVDMIVAFEEDGRHYIIMEYVPGGTLKDFIHVDDPMPTKKVLKIALDIADALARAHHLRIIHRDLKPANVLIAADGTPRLTDFGVAHVTDSSITDSDIMVGSYGYLSPEILNGETVNPRSHIWSFGIMLFEMLIGERPFQGNNPGTLINAILRNPLPPLKKLRPDIPDGLATLIEQMLEKAPEKRPATARQIGVIIESLLKGDELPAMAITTPSRFTSDTAIPRESHHLPVQTTPFVGREQEIGQLAELLQNPDTRLLTILAPGGMGKTRLAIETGRQCQYTHGVYFVPLAPLDRAEQVSPAIAEAVKLPFSGQTPGENQLLDYFREKELLLILDNCEHVIEAAYLINHILESAPGVKILATSRERLNLRAETLFSIIGIGYPPDKIAGQDMESAVKDYPSKYASIRLFVQSARRVKSDFELTGDNLPAIANLCRIVQGMPLAIELAAAWVEMLSPAEIVDELCCTPDFLETDMRDIPERQRSIRAVFDYSWQLLDENGQNVFKKLSVFRGDFSRHAAKQIAGASLRTLNSLINKSLLSRNPNGHYAVHELLRQYAAAELDADEELANTVRNQHSEYYLTFLHHLEKDLKGQRQKAALEEVEDALENIRAAWRRAVDKNLLNLLEQSIYPLWLVCEMRGWFHIGEKLFSRAVAIVRERTQQTSREKLLYARLMAADGALALRLEAYEKGRVLLEESTAILRELDSSPDLAFALAHYALVKGVFKDHKELRPWYEESLAIYRRLNDKWGEARLLHDMGNSYWYYTADENLEKAHELLEQSLKMRRELGDLFGMAYSLQNLANVKSFMGDYEESIALQKESLAIRRDIKSRWTITLSLINQAIALEKIGKYAESESILQEALVLRREYGNPVGITWVLNTLGWNVLLQGYYDRAQAYLEEGLHYARLAGNAEWILNNLRGLSEIAITRGQYTRARKYIENSQDDIPDQKSLSPKFLSGRYYRLGNIALLEKNYDLALKHYNALENLDLPALPDYIEVFPDLGRAMVAHARKEVATARQYYEKVLPVLRENSKNHLYSLILALAGLTDIYGIEGDYPMAHTCLKEAFQLAQLQPLPMKLNLLPVLATRYSREAPHTSDPNRYLSQAVMWCSLAQHHPMIWHYRREEATLLLKSLKAELDKDAFKSAVEHGRSADAEQVITAILAGFAQQESH